MRSAPNWTALWHTSSNRARAGVLAFYVRKKIVGPIVQNVEIKF